MPLDDKQRQDAILHMLDNLPIDLLVAKVVKRATQTTNLQTESDQLLQIIGMTGMVFLNAKDRERADAQPQKPTIIGG